jgi:hypothetical protein
MTIASDQTLSDRWTDWLATAAPRRLALTNYSRQLHLLAECMGAMLDVVFTADSTIP